MSLIVKELTRELDLITFKYQYEKRSSLTIPLSYLYTQKVFGFYDHTNHVVGGFILGFSNPYRTITSFSSDRFHNRLHERIMYGENLFEICCFWLSTSLIRNKELNNEAWRLLGITIENQENYDYIIYGTNSRGLALMYSYPRNSFLYHQETLNGKSNYIFISKKHFFIDGSEEIIANKEGLRIKSEIEFDFDKVIDLLLEMRDGSKIKVKV